MNFWSEHSIMERPVGVVTAFYTCTSMIRRHEIFAMKVEQTVYKFKFHLHHNLTLNTTFYFIITSYRTTQECLQGHIWIKDFSVQKPEDSPGKYMKHCGLYSKFTKLSSKHFNQIGMFAASHCYIVTSLSFIVRDKMGMTNELVTNSSPDGFCLTWLYYTVVKHIFLMQVIYLRGNYFEKLQISIVFLDTDFSPVSSVLQAFDGPGNKCTPLSLTIISEKMPLVQKGSASTFQATLYCQKVNLKVSYSSVVLLLTVCSKGLTFKAPSLCQTSSCASQQDPVH